MIDITEWEKGVKMWEGIKKQAEIDIEQADLYLSAIHKKIEEIKIGTEMKEDGE
jgi:hypothetical protein